MTEKPFPQNATQMTAGFAKINGAEISGEDINDRPFFLAKPTTVIHTVPLKVKRLTDTATLPTYATDGSACFDLYADQVRNPEIVSNVSAGDPCVIDTGLALEIPAGWCMLIFSRSGHGFKDDVRLANCVGVIDSDYRGEVKVKLTKDGDGAGWLGVFHGDRIAQAMLVPTYRVGFKEVTELSDTARGTGGFGSTGA
jgi:dUTP pyrophosphatase